MWRGGCRLNISVAASFVWRCLSGSAMAPFPHPAHRTGHADFPHPALGQTSRLHPRHVVPKPAQAYEPGVPVKVREWISSALASPDLVLEAQPPAQPHSGVVVDRPVRLRDGAYLEVVRPSSQRAVQLLHQLGGLLPSAVGSLRVDILDPALDALLRWPVPQICLAGSRQYIRPNVCPRKLNAPSGTLQIRVFSSSTVSLSLPMSLRSLCKASPALPLLHRITRSSA